MLAEPMPSRSQLRFCKWASACSVQGPISAKFRLRQPTRTLKIPASRPRSPGRAKPRSGCVRCRPCIRPFGVLLSVPRSSCRPPADSARSKAGERRKALDGDVLGVRSGGDAVMSWHPDPLVHSPPLANGRGQTKLPGGICRILTSSLFAPADRHSGLMAMASLFCS